VKCTLPQVNGSSEEEWSVWRTYEQFQEFDHEMRSSDSTFSKMMVTVAFAPVHKVRVFFHRDHTEGFMERRRKELDYYMQRIMAFPEVDCFETFAGSIKLANFIGAPHCVVGNDCEHTGDSSKLRRLKVDSNIPISSSLSALTKACAKSKTQTKSEISDEIAIQYGENILKKFKKRTRELSKDCDAVASVAKYVVFLNETFDSEFCHWLIPQVASTLSHEIKKQILLSAMVDMRNSLEKIERCVSKSSMGRRRSRTRKSNARLSERDILAHVEVMCGGDKSQLAAFKKATKSLGMREMSPDSFVSFIRTNFSTKDADEILYMVTEVIPNEKIQSQLQHLISNRYLIKF
jgi:hypothetical protein